MKDGQCVGQQPQMAHAVRRPAAQERERLRGGQRVLCRLRDHEGDVALLVVGAVDDPRQRGVADRADPQQDPHLLLPELTTHPADAREHLQGRRYVGRVDDTVSVQEVGQQNRALIEPPIRAVQRRVRGAEEAIDESGHHCRGRRTRALKRVLGCFRRLNLVFQGPRTSLHAAATPPRAAAKARFLLFHP